MFELYRAMKGDTNEVNRARNVLSALMNLRTQLSGDYRIVSWFVSILEKYFRRELSNERRVARYEETKKSHSILEWR